MTRRLRALGVLVWVPLTVATATVVAVAAVPAPLAGQADALPSLVVAPFHSARAPNLASELWAQMQEEIDELGLFERTEWEAFLDASPHARDMTAERRAELTCIHAHQLAASVGVDYVLCGGVQTGREGMMLEMHAIEIPSGAVMRLCSERAVDRGAVADDALAKLRAWSEEGRSAELPVPGIPVSSMGCE